MQIQKHAITQSLTYVVITYEFLRYIVFHDISLSTVVLNSRDW